MYPKTKDSSSSFSPRNYMSTNQTGSFNDINSQPLNNSNN